MVVNTIIEEHKKTKILNSYYNRGYEQGKRDGYMEGFNEALNQISKLYNIDLPEARGAILKDKKAGDLY